MEIIIQQMENSKFNNQLQEYQERVNELIFQPRFELLEKFIFEDNQNLRQLLISSHDSSFFLKLEKDLLIAKSEIITQLHSCFHRLQDSEVRLFRNKVRPLTQQTQTILRQGVIGIYSDLQELRQKLNSHQQKKDFCNLLTQSLKSLEILLRDHFILKQIEKLDYKLLSNHSLKEILSEKNINNSSSSLTSINSIHSIKQLISDHTLKEITRTIQSKSITMLISEQLKGEQTEIQQVLEMCRICKNTFKIRHLQKHINYCTKIQAYNSRRQQIIQNQLKLIEQMKNAVQKKAFVIQSKQQSDDVETSKIYRKIIQSFEETPKLRRTSAIGQKHRKKVVKRISLEIDEFLRFDNKNQHLQNFRLLMKERQLIQKKVLSLQNNYLHYRMENDGSENSQLSQSSIRKTIKSLKTSKLVSIKTKKSLFARKENSQSSRSDTKIHQYMQETQKLNSFKVHMDEIVNLSDQSFDNGKQRLCKSLNNITGTCQEQKTKQISFSDFEIIRFLGKGAFGKVYMARRKKTKDIYALKVVKFQQNSDQKEFVSLENENQILSQIAGQYLVKAPFSFTEGSAHFFVLEYMPGGDLAKLIEEKVYLDYNQAKFYLAQIVLALEKLHEMGIIHRDLKPQNLIFDENGHLKLTDFGLSEIRINDKIRRVRKRNQFQEEIKIQDKTKQQQRRQPQEKKSKLKSALIQGKNKVKIIGTPDYIAPEIINGESLDNLSIDWWSLGVIAYEMMVGCRPFCANTIDQVIQNISNYNIEWPQIGDEDDMINPLAADLIKKLLNTNFRDRLGSTSSLQIKSHPFFEGIIWQEVKSSTPPIRRIMDRKQKYEYNEQSQSLREQILSAIGNSQIKSSFKLDNFVRYDILIEETLDSADRQIIKHENKIKKLKSIVKNMYNFDGNQNDGQPSKFSRQRKKAKSSFSLGSDCLVYFPPEDQESTNDKIDEHQR